MHLPDEIVGLPGSQVLLLLADFADGWAALYERKVLEEKSTGHPNPTNVQWASGFRALHALTMRVYRSGVETSAGANVDPVVAAAILAARTSLASTMKGAGNG